MVKLPLPLGLEGVENLPRTKQTLQNCFADGKGNVIGRPGITQLNTTTRRARAQFEWNESLYQVGSEDLLKIDNTTTGAFSVVDTISGSQAIEWDVGFTDAVIVVKGGNIYTLDTSDVLTNITGNANMVSSVDVVIVDGRAIYVPADGGPIKFSDFGAFGTIQTLSFFDAESKPDKNKGALVLNNTLYILGSQSIEPFRNTGVGTVPFVRITNGRISTGYIGGKLQYKDTYLFLGREKGQDYGIFALEQGTALKISNERIDKILSTYTPDELSEVVSGRLKWRGYDIATFTLRNDSFGFLGGQWFLLDTVFDGQSRPWGGGFITQFEGEYFTAFEDKIGKFAKVNTDYGERITRIIEGAIVQPGWFPAQSLELGISQGYNASIGSVALQISRDGVLYGQPFYRKTGAIGKYQDRLIWNFAGGLGRHNGYIGYRLSTTEGVDFSADHIYLNTNN